MDFTSKLTTSVEIITLKIYVLKDYSRRIFKDLPFDYSNISLQNIEQVEAALKTKIINTSYSSIDELMLGINGVYYDDTKSEYLYIEVKCENNLFDSIHILDIKGDGLTKDNPLFDGFAVYPYSAVFKVACVVTQSCESVINIKPIIIKSEYIFKESLD